MMNKAPLWKYDPEIYEAIKNETKRQAECLELIASENFVSDAVLEALGSVMTNKYAEGLPGKRYYGGCEWVDVAENLARDRAKQIFGCDHVNVQPHAGAQANMAAYMTLLKLGDTFFGLDLSHGGHLTHGYKVNFSGQFYNCIAYGVSQRTETIDYDELKKLAQVHKPRLIMAGASAYPRVLDFAMFREIADEVGAFLVADIAHIAGLVAAGLHPSPVPYADIVTTTTHKTLRGPRGGMILCQAKYAKDVDRVVMPGMQGGPLMHVIAAKAVAFKEALEPEFKEYQGQIVKNAKALAEELKRLGYHLVSGGTDTHLMLVNLTTKGVTGKQAEDALGLAGITVNKNTVPFETQKPTVTSGVRLGTPALTTRGMKEPEMVVIAGLIDKALSHLGDERVTEEVKGEVGSLCRQFPLYANRI